jgi:hypothetical protein
MLPLDNPELLAAMICATEEGGPADGRVAWQYTSASPSKDTMTRIDRGEGIDDMASIRGGDCLSSNATISILITPFMFNISYSDITASGILGLAK